MPERWETEVRKLRSLTPPETVPEPHRNVGVAGPPMRQRAVAAVVALAVFAGGGVLVWRAFAPASRPGVGNIPIGEGPLPPNVGRIRCLEHRTVLMDRAIRPQDDGIHLLVDDPSGSNRLVYRTPMDLRTGSRHGSNGTLSIRDGKNFVFRPAPGNVLIDCSPHAARDYPSARRAYARLRIVDPLGLWASPNLPCKPPIRFDVHGYTGNSLEVTPDVIRANLPSIRASDDVRWVGYPGVMMWKVGLWFAVVRNDQTVATVSFWQVDAAATIYTCPGSGITRPGHPWNES